MKATRPVGKQRLLSALELDIVSRINAQRRSRGLRALRVSRGLTAAATYHTRQMGQLGFFAVRSDEKAPLAIQRFTEEADRLLGVMDRRLADVPYLAGDDYSIADIAAYPWTFAATTFLNEPLAESLTSKSAIHAWLKRVGERPAVVRGMAIPKV